MRSSWDWDNSVTHVYFKAPPYHYYGHQHEDSLAFSIYKGETLAQISAGNYYNSYEGDYIDSGPNAVGYPHHHYYYKRGLSSNTILIMNPSESIADKTYSHNFKDGSQRTSTDALINYGTASYVTGDDDWGGLIRFEDGTDYTYASGDATKGYNSTVDGHNYLSTEASPKTTLVQRDIVYLKSSGGTKDYVITFDRVNAINSSHKKVYLLHTYGESIMNGSQSSLYGDGSNGLFESTNTGAYTVTQTYGKMFVTTLLPVVGATHVYKMGGETSTTLTSGINNTDGGTFGGAAVDLNVTSSAAFPDKPIVIVDSNNSYAEGFMCTGKATGKLTGCLRGYRYWKLNDPYAHNIGAVVTQDYAHMFREVDTGNWINHPYEYGWMKTNSNLVHGAKEYGKWNLRIETTTTENNSNFLNVFYPTTDLGATNPTTTLITPTVGDMKGAFINDSVTPRITMFPTGTTNIGRVQYTASYAGGVTGKHLITGLYPSVQYAIYKNGTRVAIQTSSSQGVIAFSSTGGSTFEVTRYIINDINFYADNSDSRPAKGTLYTDPDFMTSITRITNSPTEVHSPTYGDYAQGGYPKHDIENSNGTRLIVQSFSSPGWHIYDANSPYSKITDFPSFIGSIGSNPDPRWDKNSGRQNYLYFTTGTKFYRWNVTSNTGSARDCATYPTDNPCYLHDFSNDFSGLLPYGWVSGQEEGDSDDTSRYWAFIVFDTNGTQVHLVVYDKDHNGTDNGAMTAYKSVTDSDWPYCGSPPVPCGCNGLTMSPSGNYIVCSDYNYVWDRNLQNRHIVAACCSHFDLGYDADGDEMLVDLQSYLSNAWVRMCKLSDDTCYWLAPLAANGAGGTHVSVNSTLTPGWALVSTWTPNYPSVPSDWSGHALFMVEMKKMANPTPNDHTRVWRLVHTRCQRKGYADDPFGKLNYKGTKVWWTSGWGTSFGDNGYETDLYQIDLPTTWYADLNGGVYLNQGGSNFYKSFSDTLTLADARTKIFGKLLSNSLGLTDTCSPNLSGMEHCIIHLTIQ